MNFAPVLPLLFRFLKACYRSVAEVVIKIRARKPRPPVKRSLDMEEPEVICAVKEERLRAQVLSVPKRMER